MMRCNKTSPSPPCKGGDYLNTATVTEGLRGVFLRKILTFIFDTCNYSCKILEVFVSTRKAAKTFSFAAFLFQAVAKY